MTYARWFLVGFVIAHSLSVDGGLGFSILYGVLTAHFFTKSLPWVHTHFKRFVKKYWCIFQPIVDGVSG